MAEGGDPETTNPFVPHDPDDKEIDPLIPHRGDDMEIHERTKTSTSTPKSKEHHMGETSFTDSTPSGIMRARERSQDEAVRSIKNVFPNADTSAFIARVDEYGRVEIKIIRGINNVHHKILDAHGDVIINYAKGKFPKTLFKALGKSVFEEMAENIAENERAKVEEKELDDQIANSVGEERKRRVEKRERVREGINERNQENEAIEERLPLRQR